MLTGLCCVEVVIGEKESDVQSDPQRDMLAEKRQLPCLWTGSLPCGSIPSASLTLSKVPCKDRRTRSQCRDVLYYFVSEGVRGGQL